MTGNTKMRFSERFENAKSKMQASKDTWIPKFPDFQKHNFWNIHEKCFIELRFRCFWCGCLFVLSPLKNNTKKLPNDEILLVFQVKPTNFVINPRILSLWSKMELLKFFLLRKPPVLKLLSKETNQANNRTRNSENEAQ